MKDGISKRGAVYWIQWAGWGLHRCHARDVRGCLDPCPRAARPGHRCRRPVAKCPPDCPRRGEREYLVVRESTGSTRRADAVALLAKRRLAAASGQAIPDERRVTFEDLAALIEADYTVKAHRSTPRLGRLREAFGGALALSITTDRVRAYEAERLAVGATRGTVNQELAALRRMFKLGVEAGRLTTRPVIHTPDPGNARAGFFEPDDLDAVLRALPDHLRPIMEFGALTGWRVRSEVLPLTWRQVDLAAGVVRLEPGTTKNREGREFPFSALPPLNALLREQRDRVTAIERRTGAIVPWVFPTRSGDRVHEYRRAWVKALDRAARAERGGGVRAVVRPNLVGRIVHDLRRTAVRNLERAGVPRSVAMKLTGHKTESVYRRYAIVAEADLREGVAKLAALHDARPAPAVRATG